MLWAVLWSCEGTSPDPGDRTKTHTGQDAQLVFTIAPTYERNDGRARLVGFVTLETNVPSTVRIDVDDGGHTWVHASDEPRTDHRIRVMGLRPDATHTLSVTATAGDGQTANETLSHTTDPLPADFPAYTVTSDPARMEPGVTFAMFVPYFAMVDPEGVVRWYMTTDPGEFVTSFTPRGTLLAYGDQRSLLLEYDLAGKVIESWRAARSSDVPGSAVPVDAEVFHHDAVELPNGNLLTLSVERRWVEGFPGSELTPLAPPEDTWVVGDVVIELQRDGTIVHEWPLLDVLDPLRIGYDVHVSDYWDGHFGVETADWSHANAIFYDAARDEVVVSLRHQDAVVALEHATGALSWIVAPEENWRAPWDQALLRPAGPPSYAYHQHGAKITPAGTLMLFDNGNHRASPYDPALPELLTFSRGLELELDHQARTWSPVFSFGGELDPQLFVPSHGDCDPLPQTDNVLVTFGNVVDPRLPAVQIFEVTRDDPPAVVFELTLESPAITSSAERISGLLAGF